MNITLNENNLSDQFDGWMGILETFSSSTSVEEETWELIREYSYQSLPVYENVYQDILLNKIKQEVEENTPILELGYSINIYINARDSIFSITKDFGDGYWEIFDKKSLEEALAEIEKLNQDEDIDLSYIEQQLSHLKKSDLVRLWNKASFDMEEFHIYENLDDFIREIEPEPERLARLIIGFGITDINHYIYNNNGLLETNPEPIWIDFKLLSEWVIEHPEIAQCYNIELN